MKKLSIVTIVAVFAFSITYAFENEPDGFRGIMWGTQLKDSNEIVLGYEKNDMSTYVAVNEKLEMGDAKLKYIGYQCYKNKFCSAMIVFEGLENFRYLKNTFLELYGKPTPQSDGYLYVWNGKSMFIYIMYTEDHDEGRIHYQYKPIWGSQPEDNKK